MKLYYEVLLAKDGDVIANENIINRYNRYIRFMMNRYEIIDEKTCYDEVRRNLLNAIQKIKI
ncbi:MAG: helix-turn-helix domain-containing protein [Clostridia bacterium]|nr:helix-turn-helix domain-containing protein [Clostridia bacterium]